VERSRNEIEKKLNNVKIEVTIHDEDVEYGDTGMKVAALFRGYRVEDDKMTVFVNLFNSDGKWLKNEDMVKFVIVHEVGHSIYKADLETRYNFNSLKQEMPQEMWEYVMEYHPVWYWDEELFADGFAAQVCGVQKWGDDVIFEPGIVGKVEGIKKWIKLN